MIVVAMILAAVFSGSGVAGAPIVVDGVSFKVIVHPIAFADCRDAAANLAGKEVALAHIAYRFRAVADPDDRSRRLLAASVDSEASYVEIPQITWPNMTRADVTAVDDLTEAITVHERGHLAIALDTVEDVTHLHHVMAPGNDLASERALSQMMNERQEAYDHQTGHGVHQSRASFLLRGDDVRLVCHVQ